MSDELKVKKKRKSPAKKTVKAKQVGGSKGKTVNTDKTQAVKKSVKPKKPRASKPKAVKVAKPKETKVAKPKMPKAAKPKIPRREFSLPSIDLNRLKPGKRTVRGLVAALVVALIVVCSVLYIRGNYTVKNVIVEGASHYSNKEIEKMILGEGVLSHNSIFLSMKYHDKEIKNIPFVETLNVRIMSQDTIKITVYEKAIAGFVEQMGRYIYFDKDGTVIESSDLKTAGIPQIIGMKFDYFVLNEKLPVEDEKIFKRILETSQLLAKYEIKVDKIYFDEDYNLTLYFNEAKVKLGSFDSIDEKIIRLKKILPDIENEKGILRLENYTEGTKITTFEKED